MAVGAWPSIHVIFASQLLRQKCANESQHVKIDLQIAMRIQIIYSLIKTSVNQSPPIFGRYDFQYTLLAPKTYTCSFTLVCIYIVLFLREDDVTALAGAAACRGPQNFNCVCVCVCACTCMSVCLCIVRSPDWSGLETSGLLEEFRLDF